MLFPLALLVGLAVSSAASDQKPRGYLEIAYLAEQTWSSSRDVKTPPIAPEQGDGGTAVLSDTALPRVGECMTIILSPSLLTSTTWPMVCLSLASHFGVGWLLLFGRTMRVLFAGVARSTPFFRSSSLFVNPSSWWWQICNGGTASVVEFACY
ncbi:hypothetical protein D8674_030098 [Pyrus ussuriensis x Pyrus communis]|uniref:Secreted protein n=1 Tax=Pyrus ussuriensis x Pyrus communis TaxID=2448454 RepID=A0A5N5EUF8_9ROSA|nr:hypothetical protein D8674_030098 [Pyrus ussuriensis x Pyrus communis]